MMMIDCISRLVPGVLNNNVSAEFETFHDNLLEYPQYTRPEVFMGKKVPDILLSGHHAKVEKGRREQSIIRTLKNRPELLELSLIHILWAACLCWSCIFSLYLNACEWQGERET